MKLVWCLVALFGRKTEAEDCRFSLRLRAMGRPLPLRRRRAQTPFKSLPSRPEA
ncbi:hypothetical protein SAMN05444006_1302 [Allgaiera indica]|uniref:Uncharacterized protein n=1 Tax=Allgaiera indica TaxID=765699 RepID=A0A1H3EM79_9RHOB|nr:hypothetical protein SAMN05444006_1302 [Allgaiera indica]